MEATLIYPHQLFLDHPALSKGRMVFLIEEPLYFTQYKFHKQKILLHRASMCAYKDHLEKKGYIVQYIQSNDIQETQAIGEILLKNSIKTIHIAHVVDDWLSCRIEKIVKEYSLSLLWYETPQFLTDTKSLESYWNEKKSTIQNSFYIWQRRRLDVLLDDGKPVGGKWSYDLENRKRLPKEMVVPRDPLPYTNPYIKEAGIYVERNFPSNYGTYEHFSYAVTHSEAENRLDTFLKEKFQQFGDYEDAIDTEHSVLFHSVLSPYLNIGLLTPGSVLSKVLSYAKEHNTSLASFEGFVRQLIGWREYVRMMYIYKGREMRTKNFFSSKNSLSEMWWEGNTGLLPVDHTVEVLKKTAYTHHIVRLMVAGNAMTLIGARPDDCYRWFMEWYIDAYDWVMVPNVYGMALYADGGGMVTKSYVSSSKYLMKMGNYKKGEWEDVWDALYWNFIGTHRNFFLQNSRSSLMVHLYDKFSEEMKLEYKEKAKKFLKNHYGK